MSTVTANDAPGVTLVIITERDGFAQRVRQAIRQPGMHEMPQQVVTPSKALLMPMPSDAILVLDARPSETDPLHAVKQLHTALPGHPILTISPESDAILAERILRAGAQGFLTEQDLDDVFAEAITRLAEHGSYVSEPVMQNILHGMAEPPSPATSLPIDQLSDREVTIFRLLGQSQSFQEIADELHVNVKTIATHCNNIRRKLSIATNRELAEAGSDWLNSIRNAH